jgi:DNA polymerase/3'-5' exonuclease PolX
MNKICPEGKVLNPITGRCINIKADKHIKDDKVCPEGKVLNPITGRFINIKAEKLLKDVKVCPEGKVLNPITGRCINIKADKLLKDDKVQTEEEVLEPIVNTHINEKVVIDNNVRIIENLKILVVYETLNNNQFKARAYSKVISSIELLDFPIVNIEDIKKINGVGVKIESKILEFLNTGKIFIVEKALKDPYYILHNKLGKIYGVGAVKIKELMKKVMSLEELMNKPELLNDKQKIGLKYYDDINKRIPIVEAEKHNKLINKLFKKIYKNIDFEMVGSYRRKNKDMGDIDILIKNTDGVELKSIILQLKESGYIIETLAEGKSKFMGLCKFSSKLPARRIDILITEPSKYYFALLYFTGSFTFNIYMRKIALQQNISLSEYGFKDKNNKLIDTTNIIKSEKDIFDYLKIEYVLPQYR